MPLNLELKVKLDSFKEVKKLLKKIKAEHTATFKQKDVYYATRAGLLKLRIENGSESIITYKRDEKSKDRFSDYCVIYFADGNGEKFFGSVLKTEAVVEKKRLLYMYDNTRVHLDEVKGLGTFLELETLVVKGKSDAKKRFDYIVKALELSKYKSIRKSYRDLIKAQNRKK